ncbi:lipopolysaccharide biosynthesis protein [Solitalea canadensis]|uniref:Membrane protein involved in the export of O-antigen and teichoic acid n=1 Tax=Solitalea canadensis (strain ATCC 29591 / DSM 3403 / JCM 21819 / LMG 8368 / NBRC 15130 / NCIMB 12057 / USAM 9D) TaxID=929556 RepID=H8KM60_SOLCM|nr:polysaccharide biosynthesis C-terminal domain-containing protein [Solitalea canadensis]AFD09242.1 membrane protein involved in the export of O-antigen and teichoic acid [Solitalea canadensis DSM 3403]
MGIIQKQTIKGTIYSYLGVVVGFVTTIFLRPRCLSTEENGILELLLSYSAIIVQVASLGFQAASVRFFPYFRSDHKNHHGFLFLSSAVSLVGFSVCLIGITLFGNFFWGTSESYSIIFSNYGITLWGLAFFLLFFGVLDNYNRALYDTVTGTALREFYQKFFVALSMVLLIVFTVDFNHFIYIWLIANMLPTLILTIKLARDKQLNFTPDLNFPDKGLVKGMVSFSSFAVISGFTTMIIQYIDKIMIGNLLGLSETGTYGITVYFATVIAMPARVMYRIAGTVLADKWKDNDMAGILSVYRKSCINQLLIGLLLFIGIWANINNVFHLLPPQYAAGKYVILFMGLGSLFDMVTGVNGVILATSKYFRFDTYFFVALIGVIIGANYLFIPRYGLAGAAIAAASGTFLFNLFRYIFVWVKFGLQPYSWKNLAILIIGMAVLALNYLLPALPNFIADIIVRSTLITILYVGAIYWLKLSPEMNELIDKFLVRSLKS